MAERSFLSIGEVLAEVQAEFPDITISKIRFLESQGLIDPERTPAGYRKFYEHDIDRLRNILRIQKQDYLPLKVIRDRLDREPTRADVTEAVASAADDAANPAQSVAPLANGIGQGIDAAPSDTSVPLWVREPPGKVDSVVATLTASSISLTAEELLRVAGITPQQLNELESYGIVNSREVAGERLYNDEALITARTAAEFAALGLEPRHLRMFRLAADRELAAYDQLIVPLVRQRNPQARAEATARMRRLVDLGQRMRGALVSDALGRQAGDR